MSSSPPRIMFDNLLTNENVSESVFNPPFDASGAISTLTYEYWAFDDLNAFVEIETPNGGFVNCLCLLASGLAGATVTLSKSDNGVSFETIKTKLFIEDGSAMIFLDTAHTANFWKIEFNKAVATTTIVRNLMLGSYLEFENCLMNSHAPGPYQRKTEFSTNISGDGQFLGRSISRRGIESNINFNLISSGWGRDRFQEYIEKAITDAYYLAWNPGLYESEAVYGWTDRDIGIKYTGDANKMSASWSFKGFALDRSATDIRNARILENGTQFRLTENGLYRLKEGD